MIKKKNLALTLLQIAPHGRRNSTIIFKTSRERWFWISSIGDRAYQTEPAKGAAGFRENSSSGSQEKGKKVLSIPSSLVSEGPATPKGSKSLEGNEILEGRRGGGWGGGRRRRGGGGERNLLAVSLKIWEVDRDKVYRSRERERERGVSHDSWGRV